MAKDEIELTQKNLATFRGRYGDDLFLFALEREKEDVFELEKLDENEQQVVMSVVSLIEELEKHNQGPHSLEMSLTSLALSTTPEKDPLLALCLQQRKETFSGGSSLKQVLDDVTLRAYPYLLIGARLAGMPGGFPFGMQLSLMPWEDQKRIATMISEHGSIPKLFENQKNPTDNILGVQSYVALSSGSASGLQMAMLPSLVLHTAYVWMLLRGQQLLSDFRCAVDDVIETLSTAGDSGKATVPVCLVHRGVSLPTDTSIQVDDMELIPWKTQFGAIVPPESQPARGSEQESYGFVTVKNVEIEVSVGEFDSESDSWASLDGSTLHNNLEDVSRELALAAFLTFDEPRAGLQESFRTVVTPFMMNSASFTRDSSQTTPVKLDKESIEEFQNWHSRISRVRSPHTEVGLRRLVSAIVHRRDSIDSIIDAVVSWENLFGDSEGELSFRISTAMALLLGGDEQDRVKLQKEIKKLYKARSRIVHGGTPPQGQEANQLRDRVLELSRDLYRVVYENYPEVMTGELSAQELIIRLASDGESDTKGVNPS